MPQLILIVAMFALLWVFLIRPQRARAQAHRELVTKVGVGDEILTVGGLYGDVIGSTTTTCCSRSRPERRCGSRGARSLASFRPTGGRREERGGGRKDGRS